MSTNNIAELLNMRSCRAAIKGATYEELERIRDNIAAILEERSEAEAEVRRQREEFEEKMRLLKERAAELGLNPDEITMASLEAEQQPPRPRRKVEPKYRFYVDGQEQTWTGRGRIPTALRDLMAAEGKSKEDYLINPEASDSDANFEG